MRLLESNAIEFLDEGTLRTEIPLGGETRTLYEVLSSSDELIS